MSDPIYKHIKLTGASTLSFEDAVNNAIARAAQTLRHLRWFQVLDSRGSIDDGKVKQWQVTLEVGFLLEAADEDE